MSVFDDPQFMAQSKAALRTYVLTGQEPAWLLYTPDAGEEPLPVGLDRDDVTAICAALRKAHATGNYSIHLPPHIRGTRTVFQAVAAAGGREAFLRTYGGG